MTERERAILARWLRRRALGRLAWAAVALILGGGFQLVAWTADATPGARIFLVLVASAITVVPAPLLIRDAQVGPLLRRLQDRPGELCWLYLAVTKGLGGQLLGSSLGLGFIDGRLVKISLPVDESRPLFEALAAEMPFATVGWTRENAERFRRDPRSLLIQ